MKSDVMNELLKKLANPRITVFSHRSELVKQVPDLIGIKNGEFIAVNVVSAERK